MRPKIQLFAGKATPVMVPPRPCSLNALKVVAATQKMATKGPVAEPVPVTIWAPLKGMLPNISNLPAKTPSEEGV